MLKKNQTKIGYYFIICLRIVVGTVFIPSGLLKIQGKRFSCFCPEMYSGTFFTELHHTGFYWIFLGFCQLITAFLLFSQRYTVLASLMFFSICTNIFIFTLSVGLNDKSIIMLFMLIIACLLIAWDWQRIKLLFGISPQMISDDDRVVPLKLQAASAILFVLVIIFFLITDTYY